MFNLFVECEARSMSVQVNYFMVLQVHGLYLCNFLLFLVLCRFVTSGTSDFIPVGSYFTRLYF